LDFKTEGREGLPVIAAHDGVIARVKVSPYGYGRALYLSGPTGITTVYAHLQRFAPSVEQWTRDRQYKLQQFAIDEEPKRAFSFRQGDTLGWSGNSGGSAGPHLHFEVRETSTQRPVNPLFWGFDVPDSVAPELTGLWVLPTQGGRVNGSSRPQLIKTATSKVRITGEARFGVEALDRLDGAPNRCGIYRAELWVNNERLHAWELDTLDFSVNRDMNALAYYEAWERTGDQTYRMHRLPGSRLPIHDAGTATEGVVRQDTVAVRIQVWDVHGNTRSNEWIVEWSASEEEGRQPAYAYDRDHTVVQDGASARIPRNTFYEDFDFALEPAGETGRWIIGSRGLPAAKSLVVTLPSAIPDSLRKSTLATRIDRSGDIDGTVTGEWTATGTFEFNTKTCGRYELAVDTIAPLIRPHRRHRTPSAGELVVQNFGELRFSLADDLAGIQSWEASLDGEWILFRWDPKRERIWYELADEMHAMNRAQLLEIRARDEVGNEAIWSGTVRFE
ncbi:MAG: M23 family metallopeptidase, partial [Flavobacteriales bacterium]